MSPRIRAIVALLTLAFACTACDPAPKSWTPHELEVLRSLSLSSLTPLSPDPSNAVADDERAARFGHRLFFDERLSRNASVSCATCHRPEHGFADPSPLSTGIGTTERNAPTVIGSAHSPWMFWNGRADSQWAQALGPLEHPDEMGGTRVAIVRAVAKHYLDDYVTLFGPLPDIADEDRFPLAGPRGNPEEQQAWKEMKEEDRANITRAFVNVGKAIAAYERRLHHGASRFDAYVDSLVRGSPAGMSSLNEDEVAGLRLFIGEARCTDCHAGPLFTNHDFHNVGVDFDPKGTFDFGRSEGVKLLLANEFNCLGPWSDAEPDECDDLRFLKAQGDELLGSQKVPSLRTAAVTAPYMHRGQLSTLQDVMQHYDRAPRPVHGHSDLEELVFSPAELEQVEAFLRSLSAPVDAPPGFLAPPE